MLVSQTIVPYTGISSFWSGSGIGAPNGQQLQSQPSTGSNSPSDFVNNGTVSHSFQKFWTNETNLGSSRRSLDAWFDIGFQSVALNSVSGVKGRMAYDMFGNIDFSGISLVYKKSNNPLLSNDVVFATGNVDSIRFGSASGILPINFNIVEANRSSFPFGGVVSMSGKFYAAINGGTSNSGRWDVADFDLTLSGTYTFGLLPLYLNAIGTINSGINLFTYSSALSSGGFNLYESPFIRSSGNLNLRTISIGSGNVVSTNLYISGYSPPITNYMNLFLKGQTAKSGNSNTPLFMWSTTNSGIFKTVNLITGYEEGFPDQTHAMNLFTKVVANGTSLNYLDLFIGQDTTTYSGINLYLANNWIGSSGNVNMFVSAPSGTYGAVPISGWMNMYIARQFQGISWNASLFTKVNEQLTNNFVLSISGSTSSNNAVNLYTSGLTNTSKRLNLFSNGY